MTTFVTLKHGDPPYCDANPHHWRPVLGIPNRPLNDEYNYPYRVVTWYDSEGDQLGYSFHLIRQLEVVTTIPCRECYEPFPLRALMDQELCHDCQRVADVEAHYEYVGGEND